MSYRWRRAIAWSSRLRSTDGTRLPGCRTARGASFQPPTLRQHSRTSPCRLQSLALLWRTIRNFRSQKLGYFWTIFGVAGIMLAIRKALLPPRRGVVIGKIRQSVATADPAFHCLSLSVPRSKKAWVPRLLSDCSEQMVWDFWGSCGGDE